jgi:tetratricopeptide (TPR) repeat protein
MKTNLFKLIFSSLLLVNTISFQAYAQENEKEISSLDSKGLFFKGIQKYQKKEFNKAFENFEKALAISPNHSGLLYNFGLTAEKVEKEGLAIGAWRKALTIDPYLSQAKVALEKLLSKIQKKQNLESFSDFVYVVNTRFLNKMSFNVALLLTLIIGFTFIFYFIKFFAKRRSAYLNNSAFPLLKSKDILISVLFILFVGTTILKSIHLSHNMGTLVENAVLLRTAPSIESSTLLEIYEGQHLILKKQNQDWLQVQLPKGLKGWLLKTHVFQDKESRIW